MAGISFVEVVEVGPGWNKVLASDGNVYTLKGDYNWRSNNPGNIEYGKFAISQGAIGSGKVPKGRARGFAIFPTLEAGEQARIALQFESKAYRDKTVAQAIERWAPRFENNTDAYINAVTRAAGVTPDTKMSDLTPAQRQAFLAAQSRVEGFRPGRIKAADGKPVPLEVVQQFRAKPLPGASVPQVATALDVMRPFVQPAALTPNIMVKRGQAIPQALTLVPSRRSDKTNLNFPKTDQKNDKPSSQLTSMRAEQQLIRRPVTNSPKVNSQPIMTASLKNPMARPQVASLDPGIGLPRQPPPATIAPPPNSANANLANAKNEQRIMRAASIAPMAPPVMAPVQKPQVASPQPSMLSSLWDGARGGINQAVQVASSQAAPIMKAASQINVPNAMGPTMLGSLAGRTAIARYLMNKNIGQSPSVVQGWNGGAGSQVFAVNKNGATAVTLVRPPSGGGGEMSRSFDEKNHEGQNMDVYRANRAAIGGSITQKSINEALQSGKTLFKAS